jgi:hypothetical protein
MFGSLEPRTGLYDELAHMHAKPSSHSGRIVGYPEVGKKIVTNFRVARQPESGSVSVSDSAISMMLGTEIGACSLLLTKCLA